MEAEKSVSPNASGLRFILRALYSRNYRLFFGGQGISLIGTWMQQIAMSWLVYRLTGSALWLGVVGFSSQIPAFILTPFSGVLADRWNRHRILIVTQTLSMLQAFVLAFLVMTDRIAVWQIIILGIFLGLVNSLDIPARHAFIFELVEKKEDLGNAIALNSSIFNAARLIGPSVAGVLISVVGEGMCFFLNGVSFLAVIFALALMRLKPVQKAKKNNNVLEELKEGFAYAFSFSPIRTILGFLSLFSLTGISYAVLMPIFASRILRGGPKTLGFLMAAAGLGALIAAIYLAQRKSVLGLGRIIAGAGFIFGIGLIGFSFSRVLWLSLFMLVFVGFGLMVQSAASNTVLQTIVDDDKRGRLMSLYTMAFMGMMPLGSLLAGSLASRIGAQNTLMISGMACILGALFFARSIPSLSRPIRPIYVKKGIIPAVAMGIQEADLQ